MKSMHSFLSFSCWWFRLHMGWFLGKQWVLQMNLTGDFVQVKDLEIEEAKYKRLQLFEGVYDWLPSPSKQFMDKPKDIFGLYLVLYLLHL